jgi:hypothetical protein
MCTAGLEVRPVTSFGDAQIMRGIRNECRDYMTNDTSYISFLRQSRWWMQVRNDPDWSLYLLWYNGSPIGYGIIRTKNHMRWVTGGIIRQSRGYGFGRDLFSFLTLRATEGKPAFLEVLRTNVRAFSLYKSLGYHVISDDRDGVWLMQADAA